MSGSPNKLSRFWKELKRRNVVRVITVYAGAAFVIIELINNITEPLRLPEWTPTLVIVLLAIGFPVAIIFSWIYDVKPEGGIVKTEPVKDGKAEDIPKSSNSWKIASYISFVVILGLVVLNIFGSRSGAKIDESLEKSIAVLPFQNFSTEPGQEAMCLGLTDEIINHLYRIESFDHISSLTSVLNYRDPEKNIPEIAKELGVNYILEGVYKKVGDQLRVSTQLIQAGRDGHIWQHDYDRSYEEIISIQSDIALQISGHLKAYLTDSEEQNIQTIPTANQNAYELMQQAMYHYRRGTLATLSSEEQLNLYMQAIELDTTYAEAYAAVGRHFLSQSGFRGSNEPQDVFYKALPFFEKALELDPNNWLAHLGMGNYFEWIRWDYIKAEQEFLRSIELMPNNYAPLGQYVEFLTKRNRLDDAKIYTYKLEFSPILFGREIRRRVLAGEEEDALGLLHERLELFEPLTTYKWAGETFLWLEEYDSTIYYLQKAMQFKDPDMLIPWHQANLAIAYYRTGQQKNARTIIDQLIHKSDTTAIGSPSYCIGKYFGNIGKIDSAFYWFEKAYENRSFEMPWLKMDPSLNSLKHDDRYWDLYERTGHKAYDDYMTNKKK